MNSLSTDKEDFCKLGIAVLVFLGKNVATAVLILVFYLVITPMSLIKMLFGGRPLPVRPDRYASTYWVVRKRPLQPKERFVKRY